MHQDHVGGQMKAVKSSPGLIPLRHIIKIKPLRRPWHKEIPIPTDEQFSTQKYRKNEQNKTKKLFNELGRNHRL